MSQPAFRFPGRLLLRTRRLVLRELTLDDIPDLLALGADAPVSVRLLDAPLSTPQQVEAMVLLMNLHSAFGVPAGLGNWRADDLAGRFVGLFSLMRLGGTDEVEIGARLRSQTWNQGYAEEGGHALCRYAFEQLGLPALTGLCDPSNAAVPVVLGRLGFTAEGPTLHFGRPALRFGLARETWRQRSAASGVQAPG